MQKDWIPTQVAMLALTSFRWCSNAWVHRSIQHGVNFANKVCCDGIASICGFYFTLIILYLSLNIKFSSFSLLKNLKKKPKKIGHYIFGHALVDLLIIPRLLNKDRSDFCDCQSYFRRFISHLEKIMRFRFLEWFSDWVLSGVYKGVW